MDLFSTILTESRTPASRGVLGKRMRQEMAARSMTIDNLFLRIDADVARGTIHRALMGQRVPEEKLRAILRAIRAEEPFCAPAYIPPDETPQLQRVIAFLLHHLLDNPEVAAADLQADAERRGISRRQLTVARRVIEAKAAPRVRHGPWFWWLDKY